MAYGYVELKNEELGNYEKYKRVPLGFSWTFLLFNCAVSLYRKDITELILVYFLYVFIGFISGLIGASIGTSYDEIITLCIFLAFIILCSAIYNKYHLSKQIKKGYIPYEVTDKKENPLKFNFQDGKVSITK